jgi:signal transduction histidine kinase
MAANETKDRFIGMAAHDLRNPLVVASGYTELLQGSACDAHQHELIEGISRSTGRMLRLINDLLDISKIKHGRLDLRKAEVDVAGFLRECTELNAAIGAKKGIALKAEAPEGEIRAVFDRERMHQVMDNLINNAFKYSEFGSEVTVGAAPTPEGLVLWVEDQGVGIREDELPLLFDEFAKVSSRPTAGEAGHGLGLAIVKRMVELHGGRVEVKSAPGRGARFTITLPKQNP